MTHDELKALPNVALIDLWNRQNPDKPQLKSWKQSKLILIDRILGKEEAKSEEPSPQQEERPSDTNDGPQQSMAEEAKAVKKATKSKKGKAKAKPKATTEEKRTGEIRAYAEEMLLVAKGTDEKSKRPLGLPYQDILGRVLKRFPEAKTTLNCLRWYAAKMNKQGRPGGREGPKITMPARPVSREAVAA